MNGRMIRLFMVAIVAALFTNTQVFAQDGGGETGGVEIDATGVFQSLALFDGSGQLNRQRAEAARASLNRDLAQQSDMRWVSLTRLEVEAKKLIDAGQPLPPEMLYLAGLNRITHVFYMPETNDIIVGGPAEGFFLDTHNRVCGIETRSPTIRLEDLVTALRAFGPDGSRAQVISCSIDPTNEGIEQLRQAVSHVQARFQPGDEQAVVNFFREALGMQIITIRGVSPQTHFARVMVNADYHMKLIGIGAEPNPVGITSFIEAAGPNTGSNGLHRWYFQPDYDCLMVTEDENGMELVGQGVQLVGEDERVVNGQRQGQGRMNRASTRFTRSFTDKYEQLAEEAPLFAELRNMIDLSIAAAFIQEMDLYGKAGWNMEVFGDESQFSTEYYQEPTQVAPVVNAVWKGNFFMTPIGGGVNIQPRVALNEDKMRVDESGKIAEVRDNVDLSNLAEGQWWWDQAK
ncbi:MAG: DUF1598 domain-containing protein [Planctomycetota bacterium]